MLIIKNYNIVKHTLKALHDTQFKGFRGKLNQWFHLDILSIKSMICLCIFSIANLIFIHKLLFMVIYDFIINDKSGISNGKLDKLYHNFRLNLIGAMTSNDSYAEMSSIKEITRLKDKNGKAHELDIHFAIDGIIHHNIGMIFTYELLSLNCSCNDNERVLRP